MTQPRAAVPAPRLQRASLGPLAAAFGIAILASLVAALPTASASETDADRTSLGAELVERFLTILSKPDDEKRDDLEGFLAPEFQLLRSDGRVLDRDAYLADPASVIEHHVSDLVVTGSDGVVIATYLLSATVTIDGVTRTTTAPRLSVFTQHQGDRRIAAHANFSPLELPVADGSPAP